MAIMNGYSFPDINTGWKPVTHEDSGNTSLNHTLVPIRPDVDVKPQRQPDGAMGDTGDREIIQRLEEIHQEIISLKQMMISRGSNRFAPMPGNTKRKKSRKVRPIKTIDQSGRD